MAERIKKHGNLFLAFGIGLTLTVVGIISMFGLSNPVFGNVSTTVLVTATVNEWLTFTSDTTSTLMSPDLITSGGVLNISSSTDITLTVGTNSADGYNIDVKSANTGLGSSNTIQLPAATGTLATGTDGYGIQATSTSMTVQPNYNYATSTNIVGRMLGTDGDFAGRNATTSADIVYVKVKAACDLMQPSGSYTDTITFTAIPSAP